MKRKKLASKLLSIILSAAVVMTSSFSGITLMDVNATEVPAEQTVAVSDNSTEDVVETPDSDLEETETAEDTETTVETEDSQEESADADAEDETADAEDTEEETAEENADEEEEVEESEEESVDSDMRPVEDEDVKPQKKETNMSLPMKNYVKDVELQQALVQIYNNANNPDTTVGDMTLGDMQKITSIDLSGYPSVADVTGLTYAENATIINLAGTKVKVIPANEFRGFGELTTIVLPDELEGIGDFAFQDCSKLEEINVSVNGKAEVKNTLPSSLKDTLTGNNIFNGCVKLTVINIPDFDEGMEAALQKAVCMFANCKGLTTVNVAKNVSNLSGSMFAGSGVPEGMKVTFASGSEMKMLMSGAFENANLESIDLSNCTQLAEIGDSCFSAVRNQNKKLTQIKLPASVTSLKIGVKAFYKAPLSAMYTGEKTDGFIDIPDYVISLGAGAFYKNTVMTKLHLSEKIKDIGEHTFDGCSNLASVDFTNGMKDCMITHIGNAAFRDTGKLVDATFVGKMNRLVKIGDEKLSVAATANIKELNYETGRNSGWIYGSDVFRRSGITKLELPASLRIVNSRSFYDVSSLESVIWKKGTKSQGQVYEINSEAFSGCEMLEKFVYTDTTGSGAALSIDQYAFQGCSALKVFAENDNSNGSANALPTSLAMVGKRAFADCVTLPAMSIKNRENGQVPEIGEEVFYKAYSLAKAELPASLTKIPKGLYYDAALTALPTFAGGANGVTVIGDFAFFGNRIPVVDLSSWSKLIGIGSYAFAYVDTSSNILYESDDLLTNPFKKMILPDKVASASGMIWGAGMLRGAYFFTTLSTPSWAQDDVVYIPNYIKQANCGASVFENTGVMKAHWAFTDVASGANTWSMIPESMFFGTQMTTLADCCLPSGYLVEIGKMAYASCSKLKTVDLSVYPLLQTTGEAAFANCKTLEKVVLPNNGLYTKTSKNMFRAGFFSGMASGRSMYSSAIKEIDFGGVEELGEFCFATCNEKADPIGGTNATDVWLSALERLELRGSKVKVIGRGAFKGNLGMRTASFGMVETIGESAFEQCDQLNLTGDPMSDSVRVIGNKSFYRCASLGKVTFGSGLSSIGSSAFELCAVVDNATSQSSARTMTEGTGLREMDFSKAKDLAAIGNYAFRTSGLTKVDMTATSVKEFVDNAGTFADCPYLTEVKLGESLLRVGQNVFSGCIRLNYFSFYSTTTMNKAVFKNAGKFKDDEGKKTTPISKVGFEVKPVELNVGLGRAMKFPYYVNEYVQNQAVRFDEMYIGNASNTDSTICKYVKVSASTAGYYLNKVDGQAITDPRYFEQVTDSSKMVIAINGKKVVAFDIQGLQATPSGKSIPFTVTNDFNFESADAAEGVSKKLTTTFDMKVMGIPYYPVIYTDPARTLKEKGLTLNEVTGLTSGTTEFRAERRNVTGAKTFYYDIKTTIKTNWQPDSGNLIVKTSNPKIVTCANGVKVNGADDTWLIKAEYTNAITMVSDVTKGKSIVLRPQGHGDATVTIYPEKCPEKTVTWKVQSRSDVRNISAMIPGEIASGQYVGAQFQFVQSLTNYFGETASYNDGTLYNYKKITDNTLYTMSSNPSLASIDSFGKVTINKIPKANERVMLSAWTITPAGERILDQNRDVQLKYTQMKTNVPAYSDNGETVNVTKLPSGNKLAEVTYVAPKKGATSVVIPDTMYVYGKKCKVTAIEPGAFKGKTKLKSVTIGKYIKVIPKSAFKGCTNLTSVKFKGSVTEIGTSAFENCSSLKKITIPKTVKKIGKKAFYNDKKLATVTFKTKSKLTEIGESAFQGCKAMKKITIPSTYLKKIGKSAFSGCSKLEKIVVKSKKVTSVGKNAFKGIYKKAQIDVPNSKLKTYKSLFKKGQGKKVKIK